MPITRQQWTAALRSGEYQQTTNGVLAGHFGEDDALGYCCLGVACLVAGMPQADLINQETSQFSSVGMGDLYTELGIDVSLCDKLAIENDRGVSFAKLADVIDALPFYTVDEYGAMRLPSEMSIIKEREAFDLLLV